MACPKTLTTPVDTRTNDRPISQQSRSMDISLNCLFIGLPLHVMKTILPLTSFVNVIYKILRDSDSGVADMGDNGGRRLRRQFEIASACLGKREVGGVLGGW